MQTVRLPDDELDALRRISRTKDRSVAWLVRHAVALYIIDQGEVIRSVPSDVTRASVPSLPISRFAADLDAKMDRVRRAQEASRRVASKS